MATLLHVDSSPMGGHSLTRKLTEEFVSQWKKAHPDGRVITRDLTATSLPVIDAQWVGAAYTPEDARTAEQKAKLALSEELIAELEQADEYVFGVPMHNFAIPAVLRLWIDQVSRVGKTFSYSSAGPEGLLKGKKAHFYLATGGEYGAGSPAAVMNHVEPYLQTIFGFLGVKDVTFLTAGGAAVLRSGTTDAQTFLAPHIDSIRAEFHAA